MGDCEKYFLTDQQLIHIINGDPKISRSLHRLHTSQFLTAPKKILAKINSSIVPNISNSKDLKKNTKKVAGNAIEIASNVIIHSVLSPQKILGDKKFELMKTSIIYFDALNSYFKELYDFSDMEKKAKKMLVQKSKEIGKYFFPFCCNHKSNSDTIAGIDTLLKNKLDDFFKCITDNTQNSTNISSKKVYLEHVYKNWMISIQANKSEYHFDEKSKTFPENGKNQIIKDNNDFFRYDLKTDYNNICFHVNGRWKVTKNKEMAATLPDLFSQNNDRQCFAYFICATKDFYPLGTDGILCWLRQYRNMYMSKKRWKSKKHVEPQNKNVMFPV